MKKIASINVNKPIGDQLRDLRNQRGMTIRGLAEEMDMKGFTAITHIENGRVPDPQIGTVSRILKALGYKRVEVEL